MVKDAQSAVVPGTIVTATHVASGFKVERVSDAAGRFLLPGLAVGEYRLSVAVPGFETFIQQGLVMQVSQKLDLPVILRVGQVTDVVTFPARPRSCRPSTPKSATSSAIGNRQSAIGNRQSAVVESLLKRPDISCNPNNWTGTAAAWFDTACFSLPAPYTFGDSGRNTVIGPAYADVDAGLVRSVRLSGGMRMQLRWEIFNLLNHTNFDTPTGRSGRRTSDGSSAPNPHARCSSASG